jgi:hypothetical protein
MRISVKDLRQATDRLMSHLEARGDSVELAHDFYWAVPRDARYDAYREPKDLTVGQITDDWAELRKIGSGAGEPLAYALVWLGAVLTAVGDTVVD